MLSFVGLATAAEKEYHVIGSVCFSTIFATHRHRTTDIITHHFWLDARPTAIVSWPRLVAPLLHHSLPLSPCRSITAHYYAPPLLPIYHTTMCLLLLLLLLACVAANPESLNVPEQQCKAAAASGPVMQCNTMTDFDMARHFPILWLSLFHTNLHICLLLNLFSQTILRMEMNARPMGNSTSLLTLSLSLSLSGVCTAVCQCIMPFFFLHIALGAVVCSTCHFARTLFYCLSTQYTILTYIRTSATLEKKLE